MDSSCLSIRYEKRVCCHLFTGLVLTKRFSIFHESDYSPFGTQSVTIAGIGVESHNECLTALENIHVLASLLRQDGLLRDLQYVTIDNELVLPACANICTPLNQHKSTQQVVELTKEDDPEGVVAAFGKKRSGVITEDNLVEIYFGEQLHRYAAILINYRCHLLMPIPQCRGMDIP